MSAFPILSDPEPDPSLGRELPDYLPARMVNEFAYCPRLFFYEWVEGVFQESVDTVEGAIQHRRVDSKTSALPAPGEVPEDLSCAEKCERNFEFVHSLIKQAQKNGGLDRRFDSRELAFGFYGLTHFYLVAHLVARDCVPDTKTAKRTVELFLVGAGVKQRRT